MVGNNVSHAHNVTKGRFNPNLQSVRAMNKGQAKKWLSAPTVLNQGVLLKHPNPIF